MKQYNVIIIGGGAAGFFAAINTAELNPLLKVAILERGKEGLQKVKISGGGRCNVTHAEFIPSELTQNYPRGEKELLGPFHTFMTGDTMAWFEARGVPLKIEEDGRIFPESNSSQTIIDCFLQEAQKHNVDVLYSENVKTIKPNTSGFNIETTQSVFKSDKVIIATGSSPKLWKLLETIGHSIVPPVPSLFTFNCDDKRIKAIPGVVAKQVTVKVLGTNLISKGPLLITHVGFSAPSILKLSAFGAIELAKRNYKFDIEINFIDRDYKSCLDDLKNHKQELAKKTIYKFPQFQLPKRLWQQLVLATGLEEDMRWAEVNKIEMETLAKQLTKAVFKIDGKSTFKEEFVTAGGVNLKEINFKTFESKLIPNLYFAGEVINVDAVTGGFNFQNAWTGAYIVAKHIC
ncbi:BaiN/RdsA family NAD(P)/FAD-dependent oxidoreductase [Winogradskyella immobilis]|uniref:NAD(P)/FAD-dependent oxidoreductase n=1 Tax=Winogradskyella immobilis TaxID=2816852 RepID=A0ABS8EIS4_9FLAO|nr:NAD(P)/FAD-dependent oxidoreductase [Winogradskyella immobilis]MCC1483114.1 NAD(P)/FAD-dependent oxidoreductase [Winogradskyella immobilis]MCG0015209.1 NAD(P)/FAD-dependent oxidoreductase [Winogradskyella immobilis]